MAQRGGRGRGRGHGHGGRGAGRGAAADTDPTADPDTLAPTFSDQHPELKPQSSAGASGAAGGGGRRAADGKGNNNNGANSGHASDDDPQGPQLSALTSSCVICFDASFDREGCSERTVLICDQCEREFHVSEKV